LSASLGRIYAGAIAEAGYASSMIEVLTTWPPGVVLDTVELIAWRADAHHSEVEAARQGARR
jgi:hypothetical protein